MPGDPLDYSYHNESKRIAAWRAHYLAKGCNSTKADTVAHCKVRQSWTWPPTRKYEALRAS